MSFVLVQQLDCPAHEEVPFREIQDKEFHAALQNTECAINISSYC